MEISKLLKQIGQQMALKRMKQNLTQECLADRLGLSQSNIVRYEQGKINITLETLVNLADVLGCDVQIRFTRKNQSAKLIEEEKTH